MRKIFSAADEKVKGTLANIPPELAESIIKAGLVEWGCTTNLSVKKHSKMFGDSLSKTIKTHKLPEDTELHGVYLQGSETVLCHTGNSPNSAAHARVLTGLWNWIVNELSPPPDKG